MHDTTKKVTEYAVELIDFAHDHGDKLKIEDALKIAVEIVKTEEFARAFVTDGPANTPSALEKIAMELAGLNSILAIK